MLLFEEENTPKYITIKKCIQPIIEKDLNIDGNSGLIIFFDISGSMCQLYIK